MTLKLLTLAAVASLSLGACTMTQNERTVVGSFAGAAGGLLLADLLDANDNWTLVAAVGGATAGALVAQNTRSGQCAYADGRGGYYEARCR